MSAHNASVPFEPIELGKPPYDPARTRASAEKSETGTYAIDIRLNRQVDPADLTHLTSILRARYSSFQLSEAELILVAPHLGRVSVIRFEGGDTRSFQEQVAPSLRAAIKGFSDERVAAERELREAEQQFVAERAQRRADAVANVTDIQFD